MKLIIAIVNNDDSAVVASALTREKYSVTKLSTTGGFLMVGNTTFLIGAEDQDVPHIKKIISEFSNTRKKVSTTTSTYGRGLANDILPGDEVTVVGATVFVLSVDEMEKTALGLENVKQAVEKYQGNLSVEQKDGIFCVTAVFPGNS